MVMKSIEGHFLQTYLNERFRLPYNELERAEKLSRAVESGIVTVNNVVVSDPRVPFGGIKNSGFGGVIQIWYVRIC
jgi:acyl-CoA reductase-like NAD-dependent aldehyde dehydrogenase